VFFENCTIQKEEQGFFSGRQDEVNFQALQGKQNNFDHSYPLTWINEFNSIENSDKAEWNGEGSYTAYCKETLLLEGRAIGIHKNDLAEFVGEKIDTPDILKTHMPALNKIMITYL